MTEAHIDMIVRASVPKTLAAIKRNKWHYESVKNFKAVKDELTVTPTGIILRGTRIVMPYILQQRAINLAHISHLGITKTKALIRDKIWFSGIDEMIEMHTMSSSWKQRERAY